ncbi:anion permease [Haloferax sp. AB510]|uniref:SLC13 family permease n=1 Tax=Haloferax sp. AB510 TaxID=2934172 RepID=UPI00209C0BC0|nr:SLC13 family permease [Haloferax sp. AB510]MCO8268279.1 anion permease [Haloferax sp. AB510]
MTSNFLDRSSIFGLVGAVVIVAGGLIATPPTGMTETGLTATAVFLATLLLWLIRAVPYVISSVTAVMLLYALGVSNSVQDAASGFSSSLVFFLLLLFLLGNTISEVNLDTRLADRLLGTKNSPTHALQSLTAALLSLAVFMPSAAARTVTLIPVVRRLRTSFNLSFSSDFSQTAFLILGQVNPLASIGLMTGGGMAVVTAGLIHSLVGPLTWVEWALYMVPPAVVLYLLGAVSVFALYPLSYPDIQKPMTKDTATGFNRDQQIVATVMSGTVLAWIIGSFLGIPTILPAAAAVLILALPKIRIIRADAVEDVSWNVLFLIGAMFSLLEALTNTGVVELFINQTLETIPLHALPTFASIGILLLVAVAIRTVFSTGSAALLVVVPFALRIGEQLGVNQLYLSFALLIVIGGTTFLPFNTTSALLAYEEGPLKQREVAKFGVVTLLLSLGVSTTAWLFYWPFVSSV